MVMRPVLLRYGVPGLAVGLALVLQLLLVPWFGADPDTISFLLFFAALIVAAWFGGPGPGLVATVLSALTSNYFFLYPEHSLEIVSFGQGLRLAVFSIEGVFISCLLGITHLDRRREPKRPNVASSTLSDYVVKPVGFVDFVEAFGELGLFWAVVNQSPPGSTGRTR